MNNINTDLIDKIQHWASELGFQQCSFADIDLHQHETWLNEWLAKDHHGSMEYMARHGTKRSHPEELEKGTLSVISVRMDYFPPNSQAIQQVLGDSHKAFISRYALGRDYHKLIRKRLQKLADKIQSEIGEFGYRVFTDSAPVLEKALAENAGLGWIGKHTNLINRQSGSWFFLGEIYTTLPIETRSTATENHCGSCNACIEICPTRAIIAPYKLDARRCISYLTIELKGTIPVEFRKDIGNRIYGCDDCQLVCPWNRFSRASDEKDFAVRHGLDCADLLTCFNWSEQEFLSKTEGSAIRRIGYMQWLRNIAIALGNARYSDEIMQALKSKREEVTELVQEHIDWAIESLDANRS